MPITTITAQEEGLLFERSRKGRKGYSLPKADLPDIDIKALIPEKFLLKEGPNLPELSEADVVRHFVRLSSWNYNKDAGFYPLGSCTMKYNPKICDKLAAMSEFANTHPYQAHHTGQSNIEIMYNLEKYLAEISGMDAVTLIPAAGAHGELAGMLMIRAYHQANGNPRSKVLIPDSAHGTNPASTAVCGYKSVEIKSNEKGLIDPKVVAEKMDEETAGIMITNPNTLGLFEENIFEIVEIVHNKGGLVYLDGANLNAMMGISRPGDTGVDVMHFNLHKTFATPHGGGGPGSGPVGVKSILEPYLPIPRMAKAGSQYLLDYDRPKSIGRVKAFLGNFSVLLRAYAYIRELGEDGLKRVSEMAVLNSTYIREKLKDYYDIPYDGGTLHECVFSDKRQNEHGVKTLDIAKRLMDYGLHPPTIYFPLIVHGALMIEPTETESKEACDTFINAMISIAKECEKDPELVKSAPVTTFRKRLDETKAAREPILRWKG
jgi:glycine dehydrogenase subunit 2